MCVLGNCKITLLSGPAHNYVCAVVNDLASLTLASHAETFKGPKVESHGVHHSLPSESGKERTSSARCCIAVIVVTCMMCIVGLTLGPYFIQG